MNTRSLRFRLIMWHAGLVTGVFLLCGVAMYQVLRHYLEQSLAQSLLRRTRQIAVSLLNDVEKTGEPYVVDQIKMRYAPENYDRFIRLSRRNGAVIYASGRAATFDPAGLAPAAGTAATGIALLPDGNRLLIVADEYRTPSGREYVIESGGPMQPIDTMLAHLLFMLLLGVPVVVLAAVGGGYILVGQALAPVVQIARSAEQITLHNLDGQLPLAPTGDELEQLSLALNRMIARLREAFEHNRRFLADASHELRTPLTALRGELENAVEQARLLPDLRDKVGSALEEVDRLAKIVQTLFAISRLDAGEAQQEWRRFDLAPLAAGTADQMSLLAEDKRISVNCNVEREINVEGDSARIKQVVVNLLDNAIKYTPPGGSIHLNVRARGSKAILEVVDTGIGIPAGALPHVFERFFRVDKARSRDIGGAGLGLAIVKSICTAHGGQVEVESAEGRGSRFKVELPLAQPARENKCMTDPAPQPLPVLPPWQRREAWIALIALMAIVLLCFFLLRRSQTGERISTAIPIVAVAKVDREDLYKEVPLYAEFRPYLAVELHAKVSGYLQTITVDFGDKVKAGQLLATLEIPELKDELDSAIAAEQRAGADFTNAHLVHTRLAGVNNQHANLVAQQDIDTAQARDSAAAAAVAAAKADVEKYQTLFGYTQITAPFDGVITHRYADPGALIQAGTASDTQAKPLVRLSDNYRLRLDFPVSVEFVKDIKVGDPVEVKVESLGGKMFSGAITRFTREVNDETRKMNTEIEVANPGLELTPGMYATVVLKVERRAQALSIPIQAVSLGAGGTVYVVNSDHQIEERAAVLGLETSARCEVTSGLNEGDLVMIGSRSQVHVGEKVEPQPWLEMPMK